VTKLEPCHRHMPVAGFFLQLEIPTSSIVQKKLHGHGTIHAQSSLKPLNVGCCNAYTPTSASLSRRV
jgi:hypothetical protein